MPPIIIWLALAVAAPAARITTNDITVARASDFLCDNATTYGNDNTIALFVPKLERALNVNDSHQTNDEYLIESLGGGLFHFSPSLMVFNLNRFFSAVFNPP